VPLRNRVVDQTDDRLGDPRLIEEFDHQGTSSERRIPSWCGVGWNSQILSVCVRQARLRVMLGLRCLSSASPKCPYASTPKTPNSTWVLT